MNRRTTTITMRPSDPSPSRRAQQADDQTEVEDDRDGRWEMGDDDGRCYDRRATTDGWMDGWTTYGDGRMDYVWMDGWTDGRWMYGWTTYGHVRMDG